MRFWFQAVLVGLTCLGGSGADAADLPIRPDPTLTPGVVLTTDLSVICQPGYTKTVRHTSGRLRHAIYDEYGLDRTDSHFEIDHLIPLELGGADIAENLWPQSYDTVPWNARLKDRLENRMHELACAGEVPIETLQREIAGDWVRAYGRYLGGRSRGL